LATSNVVMLGKITLRPGVFIKLYMGTCHQMADVSERDEVIGHCPLTALSEPGRVAMRLQCKDSLTGFVHLFREQASAEHGIDQNFYLGPYRTCFESE